MNTLARHLWDQEPELSPAEFEAQEAEKKEALDNAVLDAISNETWVLDLIGNHKELYPIVLRLADIASGQDVNDMSMGQVMSAAAQAVLFSQKIEEITRESLRSNYL